MSRGPRNTILVGDARQRLAELPASFVDCVVTSPPYFQLRSYHVPGQLGQEPHVDLWVEHLRAVMKEVARVLKPSGAVWLNLGDSFSTHPCFGSDRKSLLLAPERLVLALVRDGWLLRNKVVWAKTNPMPVSVSDRLNATYDFVYLLVRRQRYFFDLDVIREPHSSTRKPTCEKPDEEGHIGNLAGNRRGLARLHAEGRSGHRLGKNPGDVWRLAASRYRGAHFATFPPKLIERPIRATCPAAVCSQCGVPKAPNLSPQWSCVCAVPTQPGLVLDPFFGTGTTGAVARDLGRDWLGVELNPMFVQLARSRLGAGRRLYQRAASSPASCGLVRDPFRITGRNSAGELTLSAGRRAA